MRIQLLGYLAASAGALVLGGCAESGHHHATTRVYSSGTYGVEPVLVERRTVYVDSQPRYLPIYRTGDTYFYTYSGRRYALADGYRRTRIVHQPTSSRFDPYYDRRAISRSYVTSSDGEVVRRSVVRNDGVSPRTVTRTTRVGDDDLEEVAENYQIRREAPRVVTRRVVTTGDEYED